MNEEINYDGSQTTYCRDGELHRANGPASIWDDGVEAWYLFGEYHRYYGPQDIDDSWWLHGEQIK